MNGLDMSARYTVARWPGIAVRIDREETERFFDEWEDEDGNWHVDVEPSERGTGRVLVVMIGDDKRHAVDPEDLTLLGELDYCAECGQVGCGHDGRDRSEG